MNSKVTQHKDPDANTQTHSGRLLLSKEAHADTQTDAYSQPWANTHRHTKAYTQTNKGPNIHTY